MPIPKYGTYCIAEGRFINYKVIGDCWEYIGDKNKSNYGRVWYLGKTRYAHRLVYAKYNNVSLIDIEDRVIRHTCDNPPCVRPEHLLEGNSQDNANDRDSRGRTASRLGTKNTQVVLTEEKVLAIRQDTGTLKELAQKYGTTFSNISAIRLRKSWRHV